MNSGSDKLSPRPLPVTGHSGNQVSGAAAQILRRSAIGAVLAVLVMAAGTAPAYEGSSFQAIRAAVFSDPYSELPTYPVHAKLFGPAGGDPHNLLRGDALRTLTVPDDLFGFPAGRKLLQANGICFGGEWIIDHPSRYTGALAAGTRYPVIVRASVALGETRSGSRRAFAMAVKLFPGADPQTRVQTRNLLLMETIAGSLHPHFLDAVLDNAPSWGGLPALGQWPTALRLYRDLSAADDTLSPAGGDITFRPVTPLAIPPTGSGSSVTAPRWLRLRIAANTLRIDQPDFRDELRVENYPQQRLVWMVEAAEGKRGSKGTAHWTPLGRLVLTSSVTSQSCDTRLHFAHPRLDQEGDEP